MLELRRISASRRRGSSAAVIPVSPVSPSLAQSGTPTLYSSSAGLENDSSFSRSPPPEFVALHADIQIYEMDHHTHIVDLKCSGYETIEGTLLEEKDVSSPFPFLDMISRLIISLAEVE